MKKLWLLAVLITPLQFIHAQEVKPKPTVEQCRADQQLWLSDLKWHFPVSAPYTELDRRVGETYFCELADPASVDKYVNTRAELYAEQTNRFVAFLQSHGLYNQFVAEDAQGKRPPSWITMAPKATSIK
jgi:hypothetical protein